MLRSFDNLAKLYARLEYLLFGSKLERARDQFLEKLNSKTPTRALVLGEGDGRFTYKALFRNPLLSIDAIEQSDEMRRIAQARMESLSM